MVETKKQQPNNKRKKDEEVVVRTPFARNCRLKNGGWIRVSLSNKEVEAVTNQHRERVKQIMQECFLDACQIFMNNRVGGIGYLERVMVAQALFDKRCSKIFTEISNALDEKVRRERVEKSSPTHTQKTTAKGGELK